jgi:hypothetical protein
MAPASVEVRAAAVEVGAAAPMPVSAAAVVSAAVPTAPMPASAVIVPAPVIVAAMPAAATAIKSGSYDDPATPTIRHASPVYVTVKSGSASARGQRYA